MTDREKHNPNSQGYTNALLEDVDDKFQAILEATQPIPKIQKDLTGVKERTEAIEKKMDTWEEHIRLIPTIFEEIGSLHQDVAIIKEAMKLLDRHDKRLDNIERRLSVVEQQIH